MEKSMTMQTAPPKPEKGFRIGFVTANVFVNEIEEAGQKREVRTVELQKAYREGDEWKLTNALTLLDLPAAVRLLQLAQEHVESIEVEVFDGTDAASEENG
jgi:hypothetical protein